MLSLGEKSLLLLSFLPYLAVAGYDGWLHEKARRVPIIEQCFHAAIAVSVTALLWAVFTGRPTVATLALAVFALAAAVDEFGFHGMLVQHERRLHYLGYACFALFVATAYAMGRFT